MNEKISGEDILLAIGDIDATLLAYPKRESYRDKLLKKLSVVAVIVICVSVVFSGYYNLVMKGAHASDPNYFPGAADADGMTNAGNSDMNTDVNDSYAMPDKLMFSYDGRPINLDAGEYKIAKNKVGSMSVYLELISGGAPHVYLLDTANQIKEELTVNTNNIYGIFEISGNKLLLISSPMFDKDIHLSVKECDDHYEIDIKYITS